MSINRGLDKEDVYNVMLLNHKKMNEIILFAATWMDLEIIILSEVSQSKSSLSEERQISYNITYIWNLKK